MLSKKHMKFLDMAICLAKDNIESKNKHASVIAKGNKLLSCGINNKRTRMKNFEYNYFECHAELDAIMRVKSKCLLWDYALCC